MLTQIVLLGNVLLLSGLAVLGWRHRSEPGARAFTVLESFAAVWVGLTVIGLEIPSGELRLRIWGVSTGLSLLVVLLWAAFILRYTGRDRRLRPRQFAVLALPLGIGALLYVVAPWWLHDGLDQTSLAAGTVVHATISPVGAVLGAYIYLVFFAGLALVVKTVLEGNSIFAGQAIAFFLGTLVTVVASLGVILDVPTAGYPLTQVMLGLQAVMWGYAVFREQFLEVVPAVSHIGERAVFDEIDDGILVVGTDGTITRANPASRALLGHDPAGEPVDGVLDRMGVTTLGDLPARLEHEGRTYQVNLSDVENWRSTTVGHTLVIRDVTALTRRQQRLQVLNRIMRHNLRNDMNVVRGSAMEIRGRENGDVAEISSEIARTADGLLRISEKAVEIDQMLDHQVDPQPVELEEFLQEQVDQFAKRFPGATVTTSLDDGGVHTDPRMLAGVLEEALENAFTHAGEAPTVEVRASMDEEAVVIAVCDDGPGIPDIETAPLQSGVETPMEHATGLGLWQIYWGTRSLGGAVDFSTDVAGTTVKLTLPDLGTAERRLTARAASSTQAD